MLNWLEMAATTVCLFWHFILQSFTSYITQGMHFYMRFEYNSNDSCNDKMRVKLNRLTVSQVNSPADDQADGCKAHLYAPACLHVCVCVCICICICCCLHSKCTQGLRLAWSGSLIYLYSLPFYAHFPFCLPNTHSFSNSISGIFQANISQYRKLSPTATHRKCGPMREQKKEERECNVKHLRRRTFTVYSCVFVYVCLRAASGGVSGVFYTTAVGKCSDINFKVNIWKLKGGRVKQNNYWNFAITI